MSARPQEGRRDDRRPDDPPADAARTGDSRSNDKGRPRLPSGDSGMGRARRGILIWLVFMGLVMLWLWTQFDRPVLTDVSYTTFRQELRAGNVSDVAVEGLRVEGRLVEESHFVSAVGDTILFSEFVTHVPAFGDDELLGLLDVHDVEVTTRPETDFTWWPFLFMGLPLLLFLLIGYMIYSRMQSQGQNLFSIKKSGAKLYQHEKAETTFDDVAGADEAKEELREVVEYLRSSEHIDRLGGKVPKGVLLVGPPGTGKTLLARAVAGEAGAPFYSITGSDFMEMFVGVGASRVRDLFTEAKKSAPSIIFIDELDSIGRRRGAGLGGGHDEREQTLNQLLSELDGFEPADNVIVMAATNRPDILDPALLRPGRFDRQVTVDLPSQQGRVEILKIHARKKPLAEDVKLEEIARGTPAFSGADLENLLNEAALLAARRRQEQITKEHVSEAMDKIMMGLERKGLVLTDEERRMLAYHEAGHAVVAAVLPHSDPIHKVTIVPRGRAMGVTQQLPERDKYIYAREYMLDRMAVVMGGRAAEHLIFDTATSGAENDLKQVIHLARKMVLDWGMSERYKNVAFGGEREEVFLGGDITRRREYSEDTARQVDEEVGKIIDGAYDRALDTLQQFRAQLDEIAARLLEKEVLSGQEVLEIFGVDVEEARAATEEPAGSAVRSALGSAGGRRRRRNS